MLPGLTFGMAWAMVRMAAPHAPDLARELDSGLMVLQDPARDERARARALYDYRRALVRLDALLRGEDGAEGVSDDAT